MISQRLYISTVNRAHTVMQPDIGHILQSSLKLLQSVLPHLVHGLSGRIMRYRVYSKHGPEIQKTNDQRLTHVRPSGVIIATISPLYSPNQRVDGFDMQLTITPWLNAQPGDSQVENGLSQADLNVQRFEPAFRIIYESLPLSSSLTLPIHSRNTNCKNERYYGTYSLNPSSPTIREFKHRGQPDRKHRKKRSSHNQMAILQTRRCNPIFAFQKHLPFWMSVWMLPQ